MLRYALAALLALYALPAAAQATARPGVDCSLLTPQQAAGLPCSTPPKPSPTEPDDTRPAFCDPRPNPYARPDLAAICYAWDVTHQPKPPLPTYVVDAVYTDAYHSEQIYILAVSRSLEGVPVVTAQRVQPADGFVFSFRVDQGKPWEKLP
jgi:hypothetical protein